MLLAAWSEGVGSCPNAVSDHEAARAALEVVDEDDKIVIVLSFGYPARQRDPSARTAEEWSVRANRRPLEDVVRRLS